jgi:hypothetical protein
MQKASLDGTLETQIKEASSKIQPIREVMIRRIQLMQSGVVTKDGPTLEQVLEDEQAEKEVTAIEVEDEEETPSEDDLDEVPEEIIDETEDTEGAESEGADEATEDSDDSTDYGSMTVVQLKELLKETGKPVSGKKADLIERLKE